MNPPCHGRTALFFSEDETDKEIAKGLCGHCHRQQECLDQAVTIPMEKFGVWGGLTPYERKRYRYREGLVYTNGMREEAMGASDLQPTGTG